MSAQPVPVALLNSNMVIGSSAVAVSGMIPLAMIAGWAPTPYLAACALAGLVTTGLLLLYLRTQNRIWLLINQGYIVPPVVLLGRWFDSHGPMFFFQGICISFLPTLLLFTLGRSWVERLHRDPAPQADSYPSSPV